MKVKNIETVEIQLIAGIKKYKLPAQTNFNNRKITGISIPKNSGQDTPLAGKTIDIKNSYITLNSAGKDVIKQLPLQDIVKDNDNGGGIFELESVVISNDKSEIEVLDINSQTFTNPQSILITFYFD